MNPTGRLPPSPSEGEGWDEGAEALAATLCLENAPFLWHPQVCLGVGKRHDTPKQTWGCHHFHTLWVLVRACGTVPRLGSSAGGQVMMPLADYGFSKKFAWVADRFGVSWQLNLPGAAHPS